MLMNDDRTLAEMIESLDADEKPFAETFNTMYLNKERSMLSSFPIVGTNEYGEEIESGITTNIELVKIWRKTFNSGKSFMLDKATFGKAKSQKRVTLTVDLDSATLRIKWHNYNKELHRKTEIYVKKAEIHVNEGSGCYKITMSNALLQAILKSFKGNDVMIYIRNADYPLLFVSETYEKTEQQIEVKRQWVLLAPII